jgi:hypothetical protein
MIDEKQQQCLIDIHDRGNLIVTVGHSINTTTLFIIQ